MKSRTYYGEYSLKHWIDLLLKQNIELPAYQRSFVWKKEDTERLIKSMKEGQFIQPITIAFFEDGNNKMNLILDGQQRLTSVLIAYLGYFPDKSKYEAAAFLSSDDDSEGDDNDNVPIKWTFKEFQRYGKDKDSIIHGILNGASEKYITIDLDCNDDFLENTFLGFSYIVPASADASTKQTFFTKLFRNMNYLGKKLLPIESRKSLYYLNDGLKNYFEGKTSEGKDVLCGISLVENMKIGQIDFVRYLSILSQYMSEGGDARKVMVGYSAYSSRENYYGDYVSYIVGIDQEDRIDKFDGFVFNDIFPSGCWQQRFDTLKTKMELLRSKMGLGAKDEFTSWIDTDYWLFGMVYWVVFKNRNIPETAIDVLSTQLSAEIQTKKASEYYTKSPNLLGNIRERLQSSIDIYSRHVVPYAV